MNNTDFSTHINSSRVRITDSFWKKKMELVRTEVIPYQYEALHDRISGAEKSFSIENFRKAGLSAERIRTGVITPVYPVDKWYYDDKNSHADAFHGWVFQDSDVYKWLEAVAFSLINHPDTLLELKADNIIDLVCSAQLDDGYLDTLFIINDLSKRFTNLKDWHELYCFGHLAEAGVAYYNATGKRKLLDCSCRFADLICDNFGYDKVRGYPGHEIAEMALVKLYETTGNERYLNTARFFIDERGKKPYFYDLAEKKETVNDNYHYNQAHCQPKKQSEAVGHAVRGVYLYSGMADISKHCNDEELYNACLLLCDNIINKKMYITGGIGATVDGEAFSFDYDLPNDLAYSETCASIGLVFFLRRMLEIRPDAVWGDTIERALYNTILAGMSEDGKSFFYVNPLEVLPEASYRDSRKKHIKPVRQKWFGCACCPPNLARLISSLGEYVCTENNNTVYVHQYIGAEINSRHGKISINSDYLNTGKVHFIIETKRKFTLAVRIPEWCKEYSFTCPFRIVDGYAYFDFESDCEFDAEFKIIPRLIRCSNLVRENLDRVAVTRGPFVYCIEEADNGKNLQLLKLNKNSPLCYSDGCIIAECYREYASDKLYSEWYDMPSYCVNVKFIPYYLWANRGEGEMQVYVRL